MYLVTLEQAFHMSTGGASLDQHSPFLKTMGLLWVNLPKSHRSPSETLTILLTKQMIKMYRLKCLNLAAVCI